MKMKKTLKVFNEFDGKQYLSLMDKSNNSYSVSGKDRIADLFRLHLVSERGSLKTFKFHRNGTDLVMKLFTTQLNTNFDLIMIVRESLFDLLLYNINNRNNLNSILTNSDSIVERYKIKESIINQIKKETEQISDILQQFKSSALENKEIIISKLGHVGEKIDPSDLIRKVSIKTIDIVDRKFTLKLELESVEHGTIPVEFSLDLT